MNLSTLEQPFMQKTDVGYTYTNHQGSQKQRKDSQTLTSWYRAI